MTRTYPQLVDKHVILVINNPLLRTKEKKIHCFLLILTSQKSDVHVNVTFSSSSFLQSSVVRLLRHPIDQMEMTFVLAFLRSLFLVIG
jgi:hypothetical protein